MTKHIDMNLKLAFLEGKLLAKERAELLGKPCPSSCDRKWRAVHPGAGAGPAHRQSRPEGCSWNMC